VAGVHRLTRELDDDRYTDMMWGILTGFDAAGALRIAKHAEPPELSPCLEKFHGKDDVRHKEALSIIEAGKRMLNERPRADMPGFQPCDVDQRREEKYALRRLVERRNREAIRTGKRVHDDAQTMVD